MPYVSLQQRALGRDAVIAHPHFNLPWVKSLLADSRIQWPEDDKIIFILNTEFEKTITSVKDSVYAHLCFLRPTAEPDAVHRLEECWVLSLGHGIDGATGRSHGGFNAFILDTISGSLSFVNSHNSIPPATATITIDYKAEISTPSVIVARAWIVESKGRKVWVRAVLEDSTGKVLSSSKSLFLHAKPKPTKL